MINKFKNARELKGYDLTTQAGRDQFVKLLGTIAYDEPKNIRNSIDNMIANDHLRRKHTRHHYYGYDIWIKINVPLISRSTNLAGHLMDLTGPIIKARKIRQEAAEGDKGKIKETNKKTTGYETCDKTDLALAKVLVMQYRLMGKALKNLK